MQSIDKGLGLGTIGDSLGRKHIHDADHWRKEIMLWAKTGLSIGSGIIWYHFALLGKEMTKQAPCIRLPSSHAKEGRMSHSMKELPTFSEGVIKRWRPRHVCH